MYFEHPGIQFLPLISFIHPMCITKIHFKAVSSIMTTSVKTRIGKGHTFFGPKRALFVVKLDSEGTLFCGAAALCRTLIYAVFQSFINII